MLSVTYEVELSDECVEWFELRELRVQHEGRPYRVLYAFDPARVAYLLIGGDKTGDKRWNERMIPKAEAIYAQHLREMLPA